MSGQTKEAAPTTSKASTDELKEQELYEFFFVFLAGTSLFKLLVFLLL